MDGKLRIKQGTGTFVESPDLIRCDMGTRTRLRDNLCEQNI